MADAAHLSDEGRRPFYRTGPQLLDERAFAGRCDRTWGTGGDRGRAAGCYQPGTDTIVVYRPADPRLAGAAVVTARTSCSTPRRTRLDASGTPRSCRCSRPRRRRSPSRTAIHEQIAGSVGRTPQNRATELFAYVGTQRWRDGGAGPRARAVYARSSPTAPRWSRCTPAWVDDAGPGMDAAIRAASDVATAHELADGERTARTYEACAAASASDRQTYDAHGAEHGAMPAEQRRGLRLAWTWWDGTDLPMAPADVTLAAAADLLARDAVDLAARRGRRSVRRRTRRRWSGRTSRHWSPTCTGSTSQLVP